MILKLTTAAGTNATKIGDRYANVDPYGGNVDYYGSIDNCDSNGAGRVFLHCDDETAEWISSLLQEDDDVVSFRVEVATALSR